MLAVTELTSGGQVLCRDLADARIGPRDDHGLAVHAGVRATPSAEQPHDAPVDRNRSVGQVD